MPIAIAPSMLAADPLYLGPAAQKAAETGCDLLHMDIMDAHFVPNLAYSPATVAAFKRAGSLPMDVHLMMDNPQAYFDAFITAGAARLSFHIEIGGSQSAAWLAQIRAAGCCPGLAISPDTPVQSLTPYLPDCDFVLVMGVQPGFGGQAMLPNTFERIRAIRQASAGVDIAVDGGVLPDNAAALVAAGATTLISGTALWKAPDMAAAVRAMRQQEQTAAG